MGSHIYNSEMFLIDNSIGETSVGFVGNKKCFIQKLVICTALKSLQTFGGKTNNIV
jgi:hypothetical protein